MIYVTNLFDFFRLKMCYLNFTSKIYFKDNNSDNLILFSKISISKKNYTLKLNKWDYLIRFSGRIQHHDQDKHLL